ncbi:non-ribosomal peptide synthetase [Streptomyces sp. NPDC091292]|uniref:non-ribosomal peptide synthetase n=1 Tax=Streptomyces sp. NPDC091292 TaxID=3365991 RepID=UPI0037F74DE7
MVTDVFAVGKEGSMTAAPPGVPEPSTPLSATSWIPVTKLFSQQVENNPDAPAVEYGDQTLTYAELAGRAASLAARLREFGLRHGDMVAVTGPRTPALVAAMLAVPMAGGVLLPIDPELPDQRRELMADLAAARWQMAVEATGGGVEEVGDVENVGDIGDIGDVKIGPLGSSAEGSAEGSAERATESPSQKAAPGPDKRAAYVFFTSGTTGSPHAVLGTHRGLSHFLQWQRDAFGVGPGDRCAQLTRLSFDVVLRDVLLPLVSGATLCLPAAEEDLAPDDVVPWLERERISVVHAVPTLAHAWLSAARPGAQAGPRIVFFAGEPLTGALVERWRSVFPATGQVVNLYGPTETTLATCFHVVENPAPAGTQPLGRPIPGTQLLVLDEKREPCGVGEPGEIAVRSPYRSLGYLDDPAETARRFVPHLHGADPSDLVFLTGDRGRYGPDGVLEFLGRLDHQVKILGVRVQPEEVTAALLSHPGIAHAAVVAREDHSGTVGLEGYYVSPPSGPPVSPSELRHHLAASLPLPMVPATLRAMERLPMTARGKLDRDALRPSDPPKSQAPPPNPSDPVSAVLSGIWADVLDVDAVHSDDDFFELGGHSLLAARMLSLVKQRLGVKSGLRELLRNPELGTFTESVRRTQQRSTSGARSSRSTGSTASTGESPIPRLPRLPRPDPGPQPPPP